MSLACPPQGPVELIRSIGFDSVVIQDLAKPPVHIVPSEDNDDNGSVHFRILKNAFRVGGSNGIFTQYHEAETGHTKCQYESLLPIIEGGVEDEYDYLDYEAYCMRRFNITVVDLWFPKHGGEADDNSNLLLELPELCRVNDSVDVVKDFEAAGLVQWTLKLWCQPECHQVEQQPFTIFLTSSSSSAITKKSSQQEEKEATLQAEKDKESDMEQDETEDNNDEDDEDEPYMSESPQLSSSDSMYAGSSSSGSSEEDADEPEDETTGGGSGHLSAEQVGDEEEPQQQRHQHYCSALDYPCGDSPNTVYMCHYSAKVGHQTFCVPEPDSDVVQYYPKDYCGPCVGGFGSTNNSDDGSSPKRIY